MRASRRWLVELTGIDRTASEIADRFTGAGLEVEALEVLGRGLEYCVVAEVRSRAPHPKSEKLTLVHVWDGEQDLEIVCGAPNVPDVGRNVILARIGAKLPNGIEIAARPVAGVPSYGMLCSEEELGIGAGTAGIFVFEADAKAAPGTSIAEALGLDDVILEIGLTPNRPDCLGHVGLARELSLLYGTPFRPTPTPAPGRLARGSANAWNPPSARIDLRSFWAGAPSSLAESLALEPFEVRIADGDRCPRYGAARVRGVEVGPSPFWLRYRLHAMGARSINNVVDATNLVLFEYGHPIHAFDGERLRGGRIEVRCARQGERIRTLDEIDRELAEDDLLICDAEGPVALAGVMGGSSSEVHDGSTDVLIECAYFDPRSVRRTSRRTGLHTDASHRFERGVDPNAIATVLSAATSWVQRLAGGVAIADGLDVVAKPIERRRIGLRASRVEALIGHGISDEQSRVILEGVGCEVIGEGETRQVLAPTFRPDLGREADLIEEIVRVRGYDTIEAVVPRVSPSSEGTPAALRLRRRLRQAAASAGLYEAITYSFVSPSDLRDAGVSEEAVPLVNPLSEERSVMRTSLLPGLAAAVRGSMRHQARYVGLFELARIFGPRDDRLPREGLALAILIAGERDGWVGQTRADDFYDLKGRVEATVRGALDVDLDWSIEYGDDMLPGWAHPKRYARLSLGGTALGFAAELHPDIVEKLDLRGRPLFCEIDVDALLRAHAELGIVQAQPLPRYPAVTRDIAIVLEESYSVAEVAKAIGEAGGELVESVELFDLYRGDHVAAGHRSLAFRVVYRDPDATLKDARVDKTHARLSNELEKRFGATLRQ